MPTITKSANETFPPPWSARTPSPKSQVQQARSPYVRDWQGLDPQPLQTTAFTAYNQLATNKINGAQGRIRTSVTRRVADLQSAAINHSATCASYACRLQTRIPSPFAPELTVDSTANRAEIALKEWCEACMPEENKHYNQIRPTFAASTRPDQTTAARIVWSWRRDLNPRPSDYKSDALPTELRQPKQSNALSVKGSAQYQH
jgi:hypothetical protein